MKRQIIKAVIVGLFLSGTVLLLLNKSQQGSGTPFADAIWTLASPGAAFAFKLWGFESGKGLALEGTALIVNALIYSIACLILLNLASRLKRKMA